MSREEELPCKGLTVTYIDRILDVTDYVNEHLNTDDDPNGTNLSLIHISFTGHMGYFKRGAFQLADELQLEVVPVTIRCV